MDLVLCLIQWEKKLAAVENDEMIIEAEIDKSYVNEVRKKLPFLNDMRFI